MIFQLLGKLNMNNECVINKKVINIKNTPFILAYITIYYSIAAEIFINKNKLNSKNINSLFKISKVPFYED